MRTLLSILVTLAWALWLGGLVTLFLTVITLFRFDRTIAIQTAPQVFLMWERYQLALAACALVTTFALRLLTRSTLSSVLFVLFALSALGASLSPILLTKKMEALRAQGLSSSTEFKQLHQRSNIVYTSQTGLLLLAGILLPVTLASLRRPTPSPDSQ